ncbi:LOW QUALITY PROTEIN: hypothetical protein I204_02638 [Kwoniella mangroviensis CBS 8886]|nr:LOW QUALITY PROTEIN: hypothetical protein I204_02638 [Kwoniella mangroviensis CBS 8886]
MLTTVIRKVSSRIIRMNWKKLPIEINNQMRRTTRRILKPPNDEDDNDDDDDDSEYTSFDFYSIEEFVEKKEWYRWFGPEEIVRWKKVNEEIVGGKKKKSKGKK